jgi:DeoR/GlpR family transcriptional regulator of sugar metabolism
VIRTKKKQVKVVSPSFSSKDASFFQARDQEHQYAKEAVAKCIVDNYLTEGDSILLDAGSSLYPIAQMIAKKAQSEPGRTHFTIMTHNYKAFEVLVKEVPREANLNIVLAGGRYDQDLNALFGNQTVNAYADFFPRIVLLGISAFKAEIGLFCHGNTEELAVKKAIFEKQARDRIIVADYTKIGQVDGFRYGESQGLLSKVNRCILVTDQPPSDIPTELKDRFVKQVHILKAQGVDVNEVSAIKGAH